MFRSSSPRIFRTVVVTLALAAAPIAAAAQNAEDILRSAFDNWRADTSHAVTSMTVKRSNGTREMTMETWTSGEDKALVRFTAPARDAGNATLQIGTATYVFNPKLNQVIKLPGSAMSQSWMGSDFSYEDLSRSERVIGDYVHTLLQTRSDGGHKIYVIESVPKKGVPVVWGKQVLSVRDDGVLYSIEYFDQLGERVRTMSADKIANIDGRPYPVEMTMRVDEKPNEFTRVTTVTAEFDISIPNYLFTKSNLQNPRD
jgi:outer membrane lipoprotein-sorting protein